MRRTFPRALALAALLPNVLPCARGATPVTLTSGDLRLVIGDGADVRLYAREVPIVTESSLYLVSPGWVKVYLNHDKMAQKATVTQSEGAQAAEVAYENADAYARYRYTLGPGNRLDVRTSYGVKADRPALVEYHTYLNANVLEGSAYEAATVGGARSGVVPMRPLMGTQTEKKLTPDLTRIAFRTRLGKVTIDASGGDREALTLFDARAETQAWATRAPSFWMGVGVPARELKGAGETMHVVYTFEPAGAAPAPGGAATADAEVRATKAAVAADTGERPIIPRPKSMKEPRIAAPLLTGESRIRIPAKPSAEETRAAEEIRADLKKWWGLDVPVVRGGKAGRGAEIALATASGALKGADRPEGYTLAVRPNGASITGRDGRGVYNGAQTLKQLFRRTERGVIVKPAVIADWPTLPMRAVHWYGGPEALGFTKRMVERIVGPLKMNTVFQECEHTVWDSQPKIANPARATPKAMLRQVIAVEKEHLLEVIPILSTLGHAEWLFANGQNRDFVADPSKPYAYNPDNPRTYEVLYPIIDEVLDLFHPRILHIGHDEVTMTGAFPPPGSKKTHTQLFIEDTIRLRDHLKARGVQTMIWGDCLIHSSEIDTSAWADSLEDAVARRKAIPRDVLIADWHYRNAEPEFPSVALFQKEGFTVLPTGWSEPKAQRNLIRAAARQGAMGYLQSTWAGYAMSEALVTGPEFAQFAGYLSAAEHAWNGGDTEPEALGYSPDAEFLALWDRQPATGRAQAGFTVRLKGPAEPGLPRVDRVMGPVAFRAGAAVRLAGRLNPEGAQPESVTVGLGDRRARELHLLWAATHKLPPGTVLARVEAEWADGKREGFPVTYGEECFAFADDRTSRKASFAWRGTDADGRAVAVRRYAWTNPRPDVALRSVRLTSAGTESAPVLYGVTGVE